MSVRQYLRKATLSIGDDAGKALDLSALRFKFEVKRGDFQTPNTAEIRIYNPSPETSRRIEREFTQVVLQAGYEGNYGIIFAGTVMQFRRGRENPTDTFLDITAADGDSAYNFAVLDFSLAAGRSTGDHIEAVVRRMAEHGISGVCVSGQVDQSKSLRGRVFCGMARDELRKLAKTSNANWSIQDGKVVMIPNGAYQQGDIPVITNKTGMVGMPEQTPMGIRVRCLLNPTIRIGSLIKIDNKSLQQQRYNVSFAGGASGQNVRAFNAGKTDNDGLYYVMLVEHRGDTRATDWYSEIICLAGDAMVPEDLKYRITAPAPGPTAKELGVSN